MKQRVLIAVLPPNAANSILENIEQIVANDEFVPRLYELLDGNHVLFYNDYLDTQSDDEVFDRFLQPKAKRRSFEDEISWLYVIPRAALSLREAPSNDHEQYFRQLLQSAKTLDPRFPDATLFVFRQYIGDSTEEPRDILKPAKTPRQKPTAPKRKSAN